MKCDICRNNEATVMYREVINGKENVLSLCSACAAKKEKELTGAFFEFADPFKDGLFDGFFSPAALRKGKTEEKRCNLCGSSFSKLVKMGRVGCPNCYSVFAEELKPTLMRIHGKTNHCGKVPSSLAEKNEKKIGDKDEITVLERDLKTAIEKEEYEKAALIRDKLRSLRAR